jgi:predicted kinase
MIVLIGISGSGKSLMAEAIKRKVPFVKIVCPDEIRKQMLGSVNNQSRGKEVFEKAWADIKNFEADGYTVIFDATNLRGPETKKILANSNNFGVVMIDSFSPDKCFSRIKNDIDSGKDRSDVPEEVVKEYQYNNFLKCFEAIKDTAEYIPAGEVNFNEAVEKIVARIEKGRK